MPVHNASQFLDECLQSIYDQNVMDITMEVSIFLDSCVDNSADIIYKWKPIMEQKGIEITLGEEINGAPSGVGYARNRAVIQSKGRNLCFMDADDIMHPNRVMTQYKILQQNPSAAYTSHGPTVIMPTWFCTRSLFDAIGGFSEAGRGEPEDLIFFYAHLRNKGTVLRADGEPLLVYRHHNAATTLGVTESRIWQLRVQELECCVLRHWPHFTIWNAGKQGRRLYRSLDSNSRKKVKCFCDVDINKIGKYYTYEESTLVPKPKIPIVHFSDATPPFIICVKLNLTNGQFEENLNSLGIAEGKDYYHFN